MWKSSLSNITKFVKILTNSGTGIFESVNVPLFIMRNKTDVHFLLGC